MKFIALKTSDGTIKGNISFYCKILDVMRQGFYQYLSNQDRPWKYVVVKRFCNTSVQSTYVEYLASNGVRYPL